MSVTLEYEGRPIDASSGERLLDVILGTGIDHRHICGGRGFCTSCRVEVLSGSENLSPVSALERERLGSRAGELRLACQARIHGYVGVRVPPPAPSRFSPFDEE
jgi:ferredoxin, 2Fe-2S